MIEVEMKLPLKRPVEQDLIRLGFASGERMRETDVYFDRADETIRTNGEALRIREIISMDNGKKETVITYKGKKLDQISMTRQELETGVEDAGVCEQLFIALGFYPVEPRVIKVRHHFHRGTMNGCVDLVDGLGEFLELEVVIPEEDNREKALDEILKVLRELGYSKEDTVRNSYLSMLQGIADA